MKKPQNPRSSRRNRNYNNNMIPKKIGRYRIQGELGRGGMSTVYLAHDPHFERDVAIKLLPLELLHQPTFRRRFEREAKVVAALDHPAIVPVYDFGEEDGQPFLVMRFMMGGSLTDRLKEGALTIKEAAAIIGRLAPALDEVHAHGIVHRDLKPSNILFDNRNDPYISDFGTAKIHKAHTKLTETGGAVGTPAYMSPEQIQGDSELDGRSDIYSLGIILFEMLTGKHPYQTNTPIAVAVKHIFEPVPHILDMVPSLPIEVQEVIGHAMAKDKRERFVTAVAFANALSKIANTIETHTLMPIKEENRRTSKRHALIINTSQYNDPVLNQLVKHNDDVEYLAELLRQPKIGQFDEVKVLNNQTTDVIRRHISRFYADKQPDDFLMLYYIGHAAIGMRGRIYLTASNSEHNLLRGTTIPAGFIADEMDSSDSNHQIFILDSHFSHALETDKANIIGQTVNTGSNFTRNNPNRIIITATDSTQYMWTNGAVEGTAKPSQFTKHFIEGLESGSADIANDGAISINEIFAYVYDRVIRNSMDQQIQMPRKWSPFGPHEEESVVVAQNIKHIKDERPSGIFRSIAAAKTLTQTGVKFNIDAVQPILKQYGRYLIIPLALLVIFGFMISRGNNSENNGNNDVVFADVRTTETAVVEPTSSPTEPPTSIPTATTSATAVSETAVSPTADSIETSTPEPTNTVAPTATVVPTVVETSTAVAILSSSIYYQPDSDSTERTFVGATDTVTVLGRSQSGDWLFVQTTDGIEGFAHSPRFEWDGDFNDLPIVEGVEAVATSPSTPSGSCQAGACPALSIEIYPLPGARCEQNGKYRTVFIKGNGGNEIYSYYWDGDLIASKVNVDGFGFEIFSPDGSSQIGIGRVVSGDGQSVEQELFVDGFNQCG